MSLSLIVVVLISQVHRGFDSSFGFLDGMEDHLNHRMTTCNTSGGTDAPADDKGTDWTCWGNADPIDSCIDLECYKNAPANVAWDLWRNDAPANHSAYDLQFSQVSATSMKTFFEENI